MDLITLSDQLNVVFETSEEAHHLYHIAITHYADELTKNTLKEKKDIPPLIDRILKGEESLRSVLSDVQVLDPQTAYRSVFRCLDLILYTTIEYTPYLNEKSSHNLAVGHPTSLWLFKEHRSVEALCSVGMHLFRLVGKKDLPIALIRLQELIYRFRVFVLPKMLEYHTKSIEDLNTINPEYMKLGER